MSPTKGVDRLVIPPLQCHFPYQFRSELTRCCVIIIIIYIVPEVYAVTSAISGAKVSVITFNITELIEPPRILITYCIAFNLSPVSVGDIESLLRSEAVEQKMF